MHRPCTYPEMLQPMNEDEVAWVKGYAKEVSDTFKFTFQVDNRFPDWSRLMQRFTGVVASVLKHGFSKFSAVEETHNELCIVAALLANENPRLSVLITNLPLRAAVSQSISARRPKTV